MRPVFAGRIPLAFVGLTTVLFLAGCPERRVPFTHTTEFTREEPQWVFEGAGPGTLNGDDVLMAVGVDAHAIDYPTRLEKAVDAARQRLKNEIQAFVARKEQELLKAFDPPDDLIPIFQKALEDSAGKTAEQLAGEAEPVATYEYLLRREVFVKLAVPIEKVTNHYTATARERLKMLMEEKVNNQ